MSILICLSCTFLNIRLFNAAAKPKVYTYRDMDKLRRPNQFANLERLHNLEPPEPLLVYPDHLAKINRAEPDNTYGDDPIQWANWPRTDPPIPREFKVTPEVCSK